MHNITTDEFREYVEANEGHRYETDQGKPFTCELLAPRTPIPAFPYTIRFTWPTWSKSTVRRCGPADVVRFLGEFNTYNERPASEYRNLGAKGTSSARARYLLCLFRDLAERNRPRDGHV